ncbi:MAG: AAA family ATPase [Candidatus Omnitrophica bacterium]|nr:AAA family ATPase [Candidatus Omnitrophota bacterium]
MRTPLIVLILVAFLLNTIVPMRVFAQELTLPKPGVMVHLSPEFNPPILKGIKVHVDNPFRFEFVLDQGDSTSAEAKRESNLAKADYLKQESTKLIKYFLASLTTPEKDLWVNLSPYEKDRIVPESFGKTEMGRDLLAEDYMLKQITASLIYPEDEVGKKFWKRIYEEAGKKYGTTNIPVNTFNKVWIVPEKAVVYENAKAGTAYVVEARLKVMMEEDYLSMTKHDSPPLVGGARGGGNVNKFPLLNPPHKGEEINLLGSQIVREIIIPELTKEVNEGKNFTQLRQVYNSLILATWYKKKIKDSILAQVYADRNKVEGVRYEKSLLSLPVRQAGPNVLVGDPDTSQPLGSRLKHSGTTIDDTEGIYQRYLKAFKKGVYNYIKEEQDPVTQQPTPRKYFSGGLQMLLTESSHGFKPAFETTNDLALLSQKDLSDKALIVKVDAQPTDVHGDAAMAVSDKATNESVPVLSNASRQAFQEMFKNDRVLSVSPDAVSPEAESPADLADAQLFLFAKENNTLYLRLNPRNSNDIEEAWESVQVDADGNSKIVPGPLQQIFLQGGILLIDYNGSDSKILEALNSLFDEEPYLGTHKINPEIRSQFKVMGVISEKMLKDKTGAYYDRFKNTAPHKFETTEGLKPIPFKGESLEGVETIDLWKRPLVKKVLIGTIVMDRYGKATAKPGKIIEAILSKKSILIRAGGWKDRTDSRGQKQVSELKMMIRQILLEKGVWFNGHFEPLPEGFKIYFSEEEDYSKKDDIKNILAPEEDNSTSESPWVINRFTQSLLFSRGSVDVEGKTLSEERLDPLLNLDSVRLKVTEDLEDWVWHLMMHAPGQVKIEVDAGVYIPSVYRKYQSTASANNKAKSKTESWEHTLDAKVVLVEGEDLEVIKAMIRSRDPQAEVYPSTVNMSANDLVSSVLITRQAGKPWGFHPQVKQVIELLKQGKTVILEGVENNESILREMEGVFSKHPYVVDNGEQVSFKGRLYVTSLKGGVKDIKAAHHVVVSSNDEHILEILAQEFPERFNREHIKTLFRIRDALKLQAADVSLSRLRRMMQYESFEEALKQVVAEPLTEQPELAARIRVLARVFFSSDQTKNQVNATELMRILNAGIENNDWSKYFWQLADTISVDLLRSSGIDEKSTEHNNNALIYIQKALIKKYVTSDPLRAEYNRKKRFNTYISDQELANAPDLIESATDYESEEPVDELSEEDVVKIGKALHISPLVALIGLPGSGKSRAASLAAVALGLPIFGPFTVGPDIQEDQIIMSEEIREHGTRYTSEMVARWANSSKGGILIVDEANLPKNGFWNFLRGLFDENPYIWIKGEKIQLTKNHKVIFTGNPYSMQGRQRQDIIDQYGLTIHFKPLTRKKVKEIMNAKKQPYIPMGVADREQWVERILDLHFDVFEKMIGEGNLSLRDIQALTEQIKYRIKKGLGSWSVKDVVKEAWNVYKGHFSLEQQFALKEGIYNKFGINIENEERQEIKDFIKNNSAEFSSRKVALVDSNVRMLLGVKRSLDMRGFRLSGQQELDGKRGMINEGGSGISKDISLEAYLRILGFQDALSPEANKDPTMNFYRITASMKPQLMIDIIGQAKREGAIVIISEMNLLNSAFVEGQLNDALTGSLDKDKKPHNGFFLFATINPKGFSGRESFSSALLNRVVYERLGDYNAKELEEIVRQNLARKGLVVASMDIEYAVQAHVWIRDQIKNIGQKPTIRKLEELLTTAAKEAKPIDEQMIKRFYESFYLKLVLEGKVSLPTWKFLENYKKDSLNKAVALQELARFFSPRFRGDIRIESYKRQGDQPPAYFQEGTPSKIVLATDVFLNYRTLIGDLSHESSHNSFTRTTLTNDLEQDLEDFRHERAFKHQFPFSDLGQKKMMGFAKWRILKPMASGREIFRYLVLLYVNEQIDERWLKNRRWLIDTICPGWPVKLLLTHKETLDEIKTTSPMTTEEEEVLYQSYRADRLYKKMKKDYEALPGKKKEVIKSTPQEQQKSVADLEAAISSQEWTPAKDRKKVELTQKVVKSLAVGIGMAVVGATVVSSVQDVNVSHLLLGTAGLSAAFGTLFYLSSRGIVNFSKPIAFLDNMFNPLFMKLGWGEISWGPNIHPDASNEDLPEPVSLIKSKPMAQELFAELLTPASAEVSEGLRQVSLEAKDELNRALREAFAQFDLNFTLSASQTGSYNTPQLLRVLLTGGDIGKARQSLMGQWQRSGVKEIYLKGIEKEDGLNPIALELMRFLKEQGFVIRQINDQFTEDDLKNEAKDTNTYEVIDIQEFQKPFEAIYAYYAMKMEMEGRSPKLKEQNKTEDVMAMYEEAKTGFDRYITLNGFKKNVEVRIGPHGLNIDIHRSTQKDNKNIDEYFMVKLLNLNVGRLDSLAIDIDELDPSAYEQLRNVIVKTLIIRHMNSSVFLGGAGVSDLVLEASRDLDLDALKELNYLESLTLLDHIKRSDAVKLFDRFPMLQTIHVNGDHIQRFKALHEGSNHEAIFSYRSDREHNRNIPKGVSAEVKRQIGIIETSIRKVYGDWNMSWGYDINKDDTISLYLEADLIQRIPFDQLNRIKRITLPERVDKGLTDLFHRTSLGQFPWLKEIYKGDRRIWPLEIASESDQGLQKLTRQEQLTILDKAGAKKFGNKINNDWGFDNNPNGTFILKLKNPMRDLSWIPFEKLDLLEGIHSEFDGGADLSPIKNALELGHLPHFRGIKIHSRYLNREDILLLPKDKTSIKDQNLKPHFELNETQKQEIFEREEAFALAEQKRGVFKEVVIDGHNINVTVAKDDFSVSNVFAKLLVMTNLRKVVFFQEASAKTYAMKDVYALINRHANPHFTVYPGISIPITKEDSQSFKEDSLGAGLRLLSLQNFQALYKDSFKIDDNDYEIQLTFNKMGTVINLDPLLLTPEITKVEIPNGEIPLEQAQDFLNRHINRDTLTVIYRGQKLVPASDKEDHISSVDGLKSPFFDSVRKSFVNPDETLEAVKLRFTEEGKVSDFNKLMGFSSTPSDHVSDRAVVVKKKEGGINLSSDTLKVQVQTSGGGEIKFHIDAAQLAQLQNASGFTPLIIDILPMKDLRSFLLG